MALLPESLRQRVRERPEATSAGEEPAEFVESHRIPMLAPQAQQPVHAAAASVGAGAQPPPQVLAHMVPPGDGISREEMDVPTQCMVILASNQGQQMLSLEQLSGAKITYAADQPEPLSGVTRIQFNGKKSCVVQAKVMFQQVVAQLERSLVSQSQQQQQQQQHAQHQQQHHQQQQLLQQHHQQLQQHQQMHPPAGYGMQQYSSMADPALQTRLDIPLQQPAIHQQMGYAGSYAGTGNPFAANGIMHPEAQMAGQGASPPAPMAYVAPAQEAAPVAPPAPPSPPQQQSQPATETRGKERADRDVLDKDAVRLEIMVHSQR